MFKRFFKKKEAKAEEQAPADIKEEEKAEEKVKEIKKATVQKIEKIKEKAEETKESVEEAIQDDKCKMWLMDHICCCMKGQEAAKVGAVTSPNEV